MPDTGTEDRRQPRRVRPRFVGLRPTCTKKWFDHGAVVPTTSYGTTIAAAFLNTGKFFCDETMAELDDRSVATRNTDKNSPPGPERDEEDDGDLTDMLGELRVLLPSAQLLSAFLITVPFSSGFAKAVTTEKDIFLATFLLSVASLVLLSAPAVQHRLIRPLADRARFKRMASRQILAGSVALSVALILVTQLVLSALLGHAAGYAGAAAITALIVLFWWALPKYMRAKGRL